MLKDKLKNYHIILASGSPRRQQFFKELDLDFEIRIIAIEEKYAPSLVSTEITDYLSQLKASAYTDLQPNDILITSDTIVWHDDKALGKPGNKEEAFEMLKTLSGTTHKVITSVCFTTVNNQVTIHDTTTVWFHELTDKEITYYIKNHNTLDKAGAYGIQDWIGAIGVEKIEGSYNNVMGFPTHLVYKTLMRIAK